MTNIARLYGIEGQSVFDKPKEAKIAVAKKAIASVNKKAKAKKPKVKGRTKGKRKNERV